MAINTQTIRIDLNTGRTIPVAFAHQNDTNRQLTFQLYNNGVAFTPSSTTVKFAYKSPTVNGRYSVITGSQMASGTVSGNTVTVTLPAQYTQVSGVGLLTMILTTSGNTLRPVNIKFVCQGSADGDDQILNASDWPDGLYDYMDNWLAENEPTEIANLKSDLQHLKDDKRLYLNNGSNWTKGYISNTDGSIVSNTTVRLASVNLIYPTLFDINVSVDSGYRFRYAKFNTDDTFIELSTFFTSAKTLDKGYKYRFELAHVSDSAMSESDIDAITIDSTFVNIAYLNEQVSTQANDIAQIENDVDSRFDNVEENISQIAKPYRVDNKVTSGDVLSTQEAWASDDGSIHASSGAYLYEVSCAGYDNLNYKNSKANANHLAVAFYDENDVFTGGGSQAFSSDKTYDIPSGTTYALIASTRTITGFFDESIVVLSKTELEPRIVKPFLDDATTSYISTEINDSKSLADAINAKWSVYASTCLVANQSFFNVNREGSLDQIYAQINNNFRKNVCSTKLTIEQNIIEINKAFAHTVRRFMDAKLNTGTRLDFSLSTGLQADEPSVVISDDESTMHIFAHLKRTSTKDGVNWSSPENLVLSDSRYILHCGVNYIDSVYYLIGTTANTNGDLLLYTSTDGINFTYRGKLFESGYTIATGKTVQNWGNPYLIKEYGSGKFYLYIETQSANGYWEINLVKCTDILHSNTDGTIGDWINASNNPIISAPFNSITSASTSAGNADFAKGSDNRPIMYDGKYYMYFHSTISNVANIARAWSKDLETWTVEWVCLDDRDTPTGGDATSGNADHCIAEFKGRTYLFYSWNINDPQQNPYIKYTVDDRPILEILSLMP